VKLALVIPGFQAHERDWCIPAFTNLARELAGSVDLHVFTLRYPGVRREYNIGRVRVHAVGGGAVGGRRLLGLSLLKLWRETRVAIEKEHLRGRFDAVVGIWATESGWLATRVARRLGLPCLVHMAGGELTWLPRIKYGNARPGLAGLLVGRTLRDADRLTVPSSPLEGALRARGVDRSRVVRWALGVDTRLFSPCDGTGASRTAPFTFVTVGSLIPVKNHRWLLEGAARLRQVRPDADFRLRIVGSGPLLGELRELARGTNLEGYVEFAGEVGHERLPACYRDADCFLLGSLHEAQCMAALEAMSCGLPWIAPPVGALVDCARTAPGEPPSGIIVAGHGAEALANAMKRMMDATPDERKEWGAAARRRVEHDYHLQTQSAQLLHLIKEI
jgi:glycosyltransferase involved in cell wall biosynthesis